MPAKLGRLPSLIGEPAGGSLTADQWLVFATVVAPLAVRKRSSTFLCDMMVNLIPRFLKFGRITSQTNQLFCWIDVSVESPQLSKRNAG